MAPSIPDWLGSYIATDLKAAVEWAFTNKKRTSQIRPGTPRFRDDSTNIRGVMGFPPLTDECLLQLREVLSIGKQYTMIIVSDGFTSIQAQLSLQAMQAMEAEIDAKIDMSTKGDVFAIKAGHVVSTPWGDDCSSLRLEVDAIEYKFNLRKLLGNPTLIAERDDVKALIAKLLHLRKTQAMGVPLDYDVDPPIKVEPSEDCAGPLTTATAIKSQLEPQGVVDTTATNTQLSQIQSQLVPNRKKRKDPDLEIDGFRRLEGVNLDPPLIPPGREHMIFVRPRKRTHKLHSLVSKSLNEQILPQGKKVQAVERATDGLIEVELADSSAQNVVDTALGPPLPISSLVTSSATKDDPADGDIPMNTEDILPPNVKTNPSSTTGPTPQIRYGRKKIPSDQRRLLDQPSSWYPAPAGRTFPIPNVPVSLLSTWKDSNTTLYYTAKKSSPGQDPLDTSATPKAARSPLLSTPSSPDEAPISDWEATSPIVKPAYPPDSSASPMKQNATSNESHVASPSSELRTPSLSHPLPAKNGSALSHGKSAQLNLQPAPEAPISPSSSPTPMDSSPPSMHISPVIVEKRAPQSLRVAPAVEMPLSSSLPKLIHSSFQQPHTASSDEIAQIARVVVPQSVEPNRSVNVIPTFSDPAIQTVVRATPLSKKSSMLVVPKANAINPAKLHQQKRSEEFGKAQRKNWLKDTFTAIRGKEADLPFPDVTSAYREAYPNDKQGANAVLWEVNNAFPELSDPAAGFRLKFRHDRPEKKPTVEVPTVKKPTVEAPTVEKPRGGTYRGGNYRGGNYRGGTYRGSTYRGGTYRGGTYRGGPTVEAPTVEVPTVEKPQGGTYRGGPTVEAPPGSTYREAPPGRHPTDRPFLRPPPRGPRNDPRRGGVWRQSTFNDFARAYRNVRPGGYLHQGNRGDPGERSPHETDVLNWI